MGVFKIGEEVFWVADTYSRGPSYDPEPYLSGYDVRQGRVVSSGDGVAVLLPHDSDPAEETACLVFVDTCRVFSEHEQARTARNRLGVKRFPSDTWRYKN